jgi:molybdate transport system substrate-binding protein
MLAMAALSLLTQGMMAVGAEIKVLCSSAITPIMTQLVPRFESATGHKLTIRYDFGPVLQRQIAAGEAFDVAILSLDVEELIRQGKVAAGSRTVLGRTGIGVGVRKGAPKPDIGTTAAFKRALLDAKSVAYSREGASGLYFLGLLDRLGIAEEMKAKLRPAAADNTVGSVASGEVEMVVVGVALIAMEPRSELAGWLPAELQRYVLFTGGISAAAKEAEAGKSLLSFLTTPASLAEFKAKGLEPVEP